MAANPSRRKQIELASQTLTALLETPKTRRGLVAATVSLSLSRRYLFWWLASCVSDGTVIEYLEDGKKFFILSESPQRLRDYPDWLQPRKLPLSARGRVIRLM